MWSMPYKIFFKLVTITRSCPMNTYFGHSLVFLCIPFNHTVFNWSSAYEPLKTIKYLRRAIITFAIRRHYARIIYFPKKRKKLKQKIRKITRYNINIKQ